MKAEFEIPLPSSFNFSVGSTQYKCEVLPLSELHECMDFVFDAKRLQAEVAQIVEAWKEPVEKEVLKLDITVVHTLQGSHMLSLASYSISVIRTGASRAPKKTNDINMRNLNIAYKGDLNDELIADDVYGYTNAIARYALRFIPTHNIECKYNFVCEREKLADNLSSIIDQWQEPDQMDILDLTVCTYTKHHYMVAWFHPYRIEIQLLELFNNAFESEEINDDEKGSDPNKGGSAIPFKTLF